MKPIKDIDYVVGVKVERNRVHKKLKLSQEMYTNKILEEFRMTNYCPIASLVALRANLEVHEGLVVNFQYFQAVKLMMYLAIGTDLNLAFNVGLVSRFVSNLCEAHVKAVKRILCYIRATTNIGLTFGGSSNQQLVDYVNIDYASYTSTRQSTSGYVFLYGWAKLGWRSKN